MSSKLPSYGDRKGQAKFMNSSTSVEWKRGVMAPDKRHWWIVQPRTRKGVKSRVNLWYKIVELI